jgi:hypothetical protein
MDYFRPFSNVISIKTSRAARKKYLQYGGHQSMTPSRDVTASPLYGVFNFKVWATNLANYGVLLGIQEFNQVDLDFTLNMLDHEHGECDILVCLKRLDRST